AGPALTTRTRGRMPMAGERLVVVSYPADDEYARINTGVLDGHARVAFLDRAPAAERPALLRQAAALLSWNPERELPPGSLRQAGGPEFLQLLSAGVDHIDLAAIPPQVAVAGNVGAYAPPIAEYVLAMTLALARRLPQRHAALAAGRWDQAEPVLTLNGAVCAVLGFGGIGKATARLLRAFGARIHAVNTSGATGEPAEFTGTLADLDQVLAAADVLVISVPLTQATRGLIGARELGLMKPEAILVNVARGAIVDERALYEHLRDHPGFGAGIDVWWHEPGPGEKFATRYPLLELPNLIGSPHNSGAVAGVQQDAARQAAENVRRYLRGEPVRGLVRREDYLP
ncbi:MAG TPA: 2-hydroxyacid dehydrogenase, partial [Streptosporangiaceae bacterium]|nr:2-hydroxyacid dehydrogenase [Streptosporangiaceae bacterium]